MQRGVSERVLGTTKKYAKQVAQPEIHVPLAGGQKPWNFTSVLQDAS